MFAARNRKRDLVALALTALGLFLALSLATYHPADPPSTLVWPAHAKAQNLCGRAGALVAHALLETLGWGAWYSVVSLAGVVVVLGRNRDISDGRMRLAGWMLSLLAFVTLIAMLRPNWSPGPVVGSGGAIGATGRALLEAHVAAAGAYLLTISMLLGGLLLWTDYFVFHWATWLVAAPVRAARGKRLLAGRLRTDTPHAVPLADGPSVRIGGKPVAEVEDDEEPDDDDASDDRPEADGDDPLDAAAELGPEADGATTQLATATDVRVKKRGPVKRDERQEVMHQLDAAVTHADTSADYQLPPIEMLLENEAFSFEEQEQEVRRKAKLLEKSFASFGFNVKVVEIETGPVIAQFEVELESGLRLSKITSLADDLAIALRVPSVRIVAPIPGKNTVGIEVPNEERQLVRLREVIEEANGKAQKMKIPIYLGKDVAGNPMVADLSSLPHLLIAGRTGTGKSVCLNTILMSMLMTRRPDEVRMLLIDPKMVELSPYKTLPHLMHPVVTDMKKAEALLAWAVEKMEERYALLARAGVRHISGYNQLGEEELMERLQPESDDERKAIPTNLPYIVIVADEMADLMMTSAKEVETHIIRLAQKSRAVGIHLVLATQKPTVDVITGLIKSNLPARIAFQVASRTDSRVVLDEMGADKLLGNGDMLFLWPGTSTLIRGQGTYVSDDEINKVVEFVGTTEPDFVKELVQLKPADSTEGGPDRFKKRDELYEAAIDLVVREGRGSVSLLQRALGIGYGRGARLIDFMAEDGIVGAYNGSQAREVLVTLEQWLEMSGQVGGGTDTAITVSPKRPSNKIRPVPEKLNEEDAELDEPPFEDDEESSDEDDDDGEEDWSDEE
ncbi:MAG TPA: DNA translocase FtsK [Pirellulales bacterium]|jgi:S-DNA-T family DNA segregation ATPase FtsK/SpoIIIE|nr:DNA translocase FtsK [Pirellulales bacterium]